MPVRGCLCCCGFVAFRQPVAVAVLPERQVGLRPLFGVSLLVIHPVFFQHHWQPQPEHFQAEHVPVSVSLHIDQIGVIEISTWLTRKSELAEARRKYQELFATGNDSGARSLQMLRDIIDVKNGK